MSISGKVTDASTGKGIAGIEVVATELTNQKAFSAKTDSSGVYVIKVVPEGEYLLVVNLPREYVFRPYTKRVKVEKGKNVVHADFELPLGGAVSGTIYKSDGTTPLSNAQIFALTDKGVSMTTTDTNGRYTLTGLVPQTSTRLRIITYGYGMVEIDNISIESGQMTTDVNVVLPSPNSGVRGTVYSIGSVKTPISDAFVVFKGESGFGITTTDSNGNYAIYGLPEGTYEATVFKIGYERKQVGNIIITKGQINERNFQLSEQGLPLFTKSDESNVLDIITVTFHIDNPEYPYIKLQLVSSGSCWCTSVSFTTVIGWGISMGKALCKCTQQCGKIKCVRWENINILCACLGIGLSANWNILQYCWNAPKAGISEGWQADIPFGRTLGISVSGDCLGGGIGLGGGIYYCSCAVSIK